MTCNDEFCLRPVEREEIIVSVPSSAAGMTGTWEIAQSPDDIISITEELEAAVAEVTEVQTGEWHYPQNVHELIAIMEAAEASGLPAFLDFTGPSCLNCQIMKQTVFVLPEVQTAFESLVLISINTDPPHADLGDFQLTTYGTFTRPFYVRTQPGDIGQAWSSFFRPETAPSASASPPIWRERQVTGPPPPMAKQIALRNPAVGAVFSCWPSSEAFSP